MAKPIVDKKRWSVLLTDHNGAQELINSRWDDERVRHPDEPPRVLLFTTRRTTQAWCQRERGRLAKSGTIARFWRLQPVRVRETVALLGSKAT